jgi:hypothetical protein
MGVVMAVSLGAVAYFLGPLFIDLGEDQSDDLARQFAEFRADYGENTLDYLASGLIFFLMLGLSALVVSAAIGTDVERETFKHMGPHPADKKAMMKAYKKELKERQRRAKQRQAQLKKQK